MTRIHQLAISDEGFIFDPSTGESFTANSTAMVILKGLKENKSVQEIAADLNKEFESDSEDLERDVVDFISVLNGYKLA